MAAQPPGNTELLARIERLRARAARIPGRGEQFARQLDRIAERTVMNPASASHLDAALGMLERLMSTAEDPAYGSASAQEKAKIARDMLAGDVGGSMRGKLDEMAGSLRETARVFDSFGKILRGERETVDVPDVAEPGQDPLDGVGLVLGDIATAGRGPAAIAVHPGAGRHGHLARPVGQERSMSPAFARCWRLCQRPRSAACSPGPSATRT